MSKFFSSSSGKNVKLSSLGAIIQARQLRNSALNGVVKGEVVKSSSLNAFATLFAQRELTTALNAVTINSTLNNGLIAYWKLDGNSTDVFGLGNGTDTGITYSGANGKINNGAGFNGSTSKVVLPQLASFKPTQMTVSAWVKTTDASNYTSIFQSYNQNGYIAGFEFRKNTANKLEFVVGNNTAISPNTGYQIGVSTASINTGAFVHVVGTYDGANIRTYVNGVADGVMAYSAGLAYQSDTRTRIGVNNYTGSTEVYFWNGAIDEVGFWNRALTLSEIQELYLSSVGNQYPF